MAKKTVKRCIVWNCTNKTSEGSFIGDLCSPCHQFIVSGEGRYSQAYRNALKVIVGEGVRWFEKLAKFVLDPTAKGRLPRESDEQDHG